MLPGQFVNEVELGRRESVATCRDKLCEDWTPEEEGPAAALEEGACEEVAAGPPSKALCCGIS